MYVLCGSQGLKDDQELVTISRPASKEGRSSKSSHPPSIAPSITTSPVVTTPAKTNAAPLATFLSSKARGTLPVSSGPLIPYSLSKDLSTHHRLPGQEMRAKSLNPEFLEELHETQTQMPETSTLEELKQSYIFFGLALSLVVPHNKRYFSTPSGKHFESKTRRAAHPESSKPELLIGHQVKSDTATLDQILANERSLSSQSRVSHIRVPTSEFKSIPAPPAVLAFTEGWLLKYVVSQNRSSSKTWQCQPRSVLEP